MARNPAPERTNNHMYVGAKTGGGKSQLMRNVLVPGRGIRAMFWDVDNDHLCQHYTNRRAFMGALAAGDKSGKPFRVGWSGDDDPATFEWFCRAAWAVLDGRHDTWVICEEMADLEMGQRMPAYLRKLMVRGRKYGARVVVTTQRCQEIPKALITQPAHRYIGIHEDQDARYMERATGIKAAELEALEPLHFYHKGPEGTAKIRTQYRKFTIKEKTPT